MILYFLKTILLLGIFYTLYTVFLKNIKAFRWNRFYLLLTALLAVALPLLNEIMSFKSAAVIGQSKTLVLTLNTINVYANAVRNTELDFAKIILGIYFVGLLFGILRVILGFMVIYRIKQNARLETIEGRSVYFSEQIESPFSFNRHIYIPLLFKDKPVLDTILQHEFAHIHMKHSRDKVLFSFLQAIFWFNPFIYLYHKELELVHEFEADEFSTKKIVTDDYVQNLLETIAYHQTPTLLVHHFFHHPLKTRITMLYKKTKNAFGLKCIVAATVVVACLLMLFIQSCGQKQAVDAPRKYSIESILGDTILFENPTDGTVESMMITKDPDTVYDDADHMPDFAGGETAMMNYISESLKYPEFESKNKIEGKVTVKFVVDQKGKIRDVKAIRVPPRGENLAREAIRVVEHMPDWKPGTKEGKPVSVSFSLPFTFKLN